MTKKHLKNYITFFMVIIMLFSIMLPSFAMASPLCSNGDFNEDGTFDENDAIFLLYSYFFGEAYPTSYDKDVNADGSFDENDAIYLLYSYFFGSEAYPLYQGKQQDPETKEDINYSMDYPAGYVSNLGHNENGGIVGGIPGDQYGDEWMIKPFASGSWSAVFRYEDPQVAHLIAQLAVNAALNDHIGYDQNYRLTFWEQLQKNNYNPGNITVDCTADCSSGVAAIVKSVGYILNISNLKSVNEGMATSSEVVTLKAAGFSYITDPEYFTSSKYLKEGDILFRNGHTCSVVTNGSDYNNGPEYQKAGEEPTYDPSKRVYIENGSKGETVKELQHKLNLLGYRDGENKLLVEDGDYGPRTFQAVCKLQDEYNLGADGILNPNGGTWAVIDMFINNPIKLQVTTVSGELNVRDFPVTGNSIGALAHGAIVTAYRSDPVTGWYYVPAYEGWSSNKFLTRVD